uniref:Uncharacterized protein n=1 Tax=viral metagenome TaxID=1070528 RepID=A0A6H1ZGG1_9ZZZZ
MKCPYCKEEAEWCENKAIYGRNYGKSFMCYFCKNCDAYAGCHKNSRKALGTIANKELRQKRMRTHEVVDSLWKTGQYKRATVYKRLSEAFGFQVHIGEADEKICDEIIKTVPLIFNQTK